MNPAKKFRRKWAVAAIYRLVTLAGSFLVVQWWYEGYVLPKADEADLTQSILKEQDPEKAGKTRTSLVVILRDPEQQIIVSLGLWSVFLLVELFLRVQRERKCLGETFIQLGKGERVIPGNALHYYRVIRELCARRPSLQGRLLVEFLANGLQRFHSSQSLATVGESIQKDKDLAGDQMDTDLAMIRFVGWVIPSIGFIGTVRGIGIALAQAEEAIQGNITGVTAALGLAFNSTLVALLVSIGLTFFLYMLQSAQENLILDLDRYCQEHLLNAMKVPSGQEAGGEGSAAMPSPAG